VRKLLGREIHSVMRNFNLRKQEVSKINNLVSTGVLKMMKEFKAKK
jgi:hypothetical protein